MKESQENKIIFEEIVLEDTREINGGLTLTVRPPRLSGLVATTPDILDISDITLKVKTTL